MYFVRNLGRGERFPDRTILAVLLFAVAGSLSAQTSGIPQSQSFGSVSVGSSSSTLTLSYTPSGISAAPTFSLSYGLEFTAATPSCTTSGTISCTIGVKFSPLYPGTRTDALIVKDHSGNYLGETYLYGTGSAPQFALTPGIIATIAGSAGSFGYSGDGSAATAAVLADPQGVAVDAAGNVYITDTANEVVRRIAASGGVINTIAGTPDSPGYSGDGSYGVLAKLNNPTGLAIDSAGNVYIADQGNGLIRKLNMATALISTVAGGGNGHSGTDSYGDGGPATSALLSGPNDVAVDSVGNLYIADSYHGLVRKVTASTGIISILAGGGDGGGTDGLGDGEAATDATLYNPTGVAVDSSGNVYVADSGDCMIRRINASSGEITAVAGNGYSGYWGDFGPATSAELQNPTGVRVDAAGNLYISDFGANVIREVSAASGVIYTVAGTGTGSDSGDNGSATNASIEAPWNLAIDGAGNLYFVDNANNVVRKVSVNSSALAFASVNIGQASNPELVTVSNTGNQTLNLSAVSVGTNFRQQSSGYTDCSATFAIAFGNNCFVAVASVPTVTGTLTGTLTLTGNSLNHTGTSEHATLTGTGSNAAVPKVTISPSSLSFGSQNVGVVSAAENVTLSNTGTASLSILSIWLTGSAAADFSLSTTCGSTLAANASCTVSMTFTPGATGTRSASLMFTDSVSSSPQSVSLAGTGVQPQTSPAVASFSPSSLTFGTQNVGTSSSPMAVMLTNSGGTALGLSGVSLAGTNASDFSLSTTCGATITPAANCSFSVIFTPLVSGTRSASLTFSDSASNSPQSISISGTGAVPNTIPSVSFTQIPGALTQISVGADGTVWGLNSGGQIFEYNSGNPGWTLIPGTLSRILVGSGSAVWGLNASQEIFSRNVAAGSWTMIPGALVQLVVGCDGDVWGLNASESIYHYEVANQTWQQIPGTLAQLAVGSDGAVWGINGGDAVYRFNNATQSFSAVPGSLTQIAVGADGDVWGLDNQTVFHFNPLTQTFTAMAGALKQLAVGSGGNVYGLNSSNQVCQYNAQSQSCAWMNPALTQIAAGANGAVWGLDASSNIWTLNQATQASGVFHPMPGSMSQIAVAADGSVWALNAAGGIFAFNASTQQWTQAPGALAQIAIAPEGVVWGLNSTGQIFRFNPSTQGWTMMPGALAQIAVGGNGAVWGLNSSGQIFSFNASSQSWTLVPGALSQISVGADGTVWGINSGGQSYVYEPSSNSWRGTSGTFSQIAVGSSSNVWGLGPQGQIYRFNSQTKAWTTIPGALARIAVAFDGAVWGVNSGHQIYQFNSQSNGWQQVSGSLAQIQIASDAVVWGLDPSGVPYRFE